MNPDIRIRVWLSLMCSFVLGLVSASAWWACVMYGWNDGRSAMVIFPVGLTIATVAFFIGSIQWLLGNIK